MIKSKIVQNIDKSEKSCPNGQDFLFLCRIISVYLKMGGKV